MAASYVLGIDPGQSPDRTAVALIEYEDVHDADYRLRALYRYPRGTPYTDLGEPIAGKLEEAPLKDRVNVAVDATGGGRPLVDYLLDELYPTRLFAITITAGAAVTGGHRDPHVPKRDLIVTTGLILEQRRLRIAENMGETTALLDELRAYRRITSERGTQTYSAPSGSHDDLLLALSLALWTAENRSPPARPYQSGNPNRLPPMDHIGGSSRIWNWEI